VSLQLSRDVFAMPYKELSKYRFYGNIKVHGVECRYKWEEGRNEKCFSLSNCQSHEKNHI
jgi:hypothetical protein